MRMRAAGFGRAAPIKKPAAAGAAGFDHGCDPLETLAHFDEGQATFIHLSTPRAEFRVVLPAIASCLLTLFRRERLLGET